MPPINTNKDVLLDVCMSTMYLSNVLVYRVTWGKAPRFGDDLSLTYLFASTSEKSYMYITNDMLSIY